jgi:hypothetical protein
MVDRQKEADKSDKMQSANTHHSPLTTHHSGFERTASLKIQGCFYYGVTRRLITVAHTTARLPRDVVVCKRELAP